MECRGADCERIPRLHFLTGTELPGVRDLEAGRRVQSEGWVHGEGARIEAFRNGRMMAGACVGASGRWKASISVSNVSPDQ
jgi:hypothetical protein